MAFFGLLKNKRKMFDDVGEDRNSESSQKKALTEKKVESMNNLSRSDPIMQMLANIPDTQEQQDSRQLKTYDIIAFEPTGDGSKRQKQISGVKASSPSELIRLYAADGVQIQIVREYGGDQPANKAQEGKQKAEQDVKQPTLQRHNPPSPGLPISSQQSQQTESKEVQTPRSIPLQVEKTAPKFFEIGGVKCKLDNGKMYQEQWVRVDSSKYRLISDKTNKSCPMAGKHLETLKWVLIEDNGESDNA